MIISFISSKESDEIRTIHTKSNNIEIMMGNEPDEIIEEPFESLLQKDQQGWEEKMRGSEFVFDSVDLLHYILHKISLNRIGSYIDSSKWLKNKKKTMSPKNNDDIKPFIDESSLHKKDWKKSESNNKSIALNVLYVPHNTEKIRHAYKSKYNKQRENRVTLLMITDGEKWHYLAVKKISALLRGVTSNYVGDFYCLNYFYSYSAEKNPT